MRKLVLLLVLGTASIAGAQTITYPGLSTNNTFTNTNTFQGRFDASASSSSAPIKVGLFAAAPVTCVASKDLYLATDTPTSPLLYVCNATGNGWVLAAGNATQLQGFALPVPTAAGQIPTVNPAVNAMVMQLPPRTDFRAPGVLFDNSTNNDTPFAAFLASIATTGAAATSPPGTARLTTFSYINNPRHLRLTGQHGMGLGESITPVSTLLCTRTDTGTCFDFTGTAGVEIDHMGIEFNSALFGGTLIKCQNPGAGSDCGLLNLHDNTIGGHAQTPGNGSETLLSLKNSILGTVANNNFEFAHVCIDGRVVNTAYANGYTLLGNQFSKCGVRVAGQDGAAIQNGGTAWKIQGGSVEGIGGGGIAYRDTLDAGCTGCSFDSIWVGDQTVDRGGWFQLHPGVYAFHNDFISGGNGVPAIKLSDPAVYGPFYGLIIDKTNLIAGDIDLGATTKIISASIDVPLQAIYFTPNDGRSNSNVTSLVRSGNVVTGTVVADISNYTAANGLMQVCVGAATNDSFNGCATVTATPTIHTFTYPQTGANATETNAVVSFGVSNRIYNAFRTDGSRVNVNVAAQNPLGLSTAYVGDAATHQGVNQGQRTIPEPLSFGRNNPQVTRALDGEGGLYVHAVTVQGGAFAPVAGPFYTPGAATHTYKIYAKDKFGNRKLAPYTYSNTNFPNDLTISSVKFVPWCNSRINGASSVVDDVADVDFVRDGNMIGHAIIDPGSSSCIEVVDNGQTGTSYTAPDHEEGGDISGDGNVTAGQFKTTTNCSSSASPAVCAANPAGSVVVAAAATTVVVNTSVVTANSQILLTRDNSLGTKLSVTCNTQSSLVLGTPYVSARTPGTSFTITIDVGPTTDPMCISYHVIN